MEITSLRKWTGNTPLTKDFKLLLSIGALYSLSVALSNTFVNVYLWRLTEGYFQVGIYNLAIVLTQPFFFIFAGRIAKQVDRIIVFRIGVFLLALYYSTVLMLGERVSAFLWLIGGLLGMGYGFYWLAYNVLTFEITEPETRDFFNGMVGVLGSLGGMIGPLVAGFILMRYLKNGYSIIFVISLSLFALATILSFFMVRRPAKGRYFFIDVLKRRKTNIHWRMITYANFSQGLREGIFAFIINLYVFLAGRSEMALGKFAFINSLVSSIAYFFAGRFIKNSLRQKAIFLGGLFLFLAVFIILLWPNYVSFLIYGVIISTAYPVILVPYLSTVYDVIGAASEAGELRIEYVVVRELFLNLGRIVSVTVFLIAISFFEVETATRFLLVLFGAGYLLIYFFIRKIK